MQATELLRSLDSLPYGERSRLIAQEAQRLRGTQELVGLLEQLSRGTAFERVVGLQLAQIAGQADYVAHLLADPDSTVQARALAAVSRGVAVSDETLRTLYDDAPAALRGKLLRVIRRTGRQNLATRLIEEHRDRWGDRSAAAILSSTDNATLARLLPELAYCLSAGEWQRLAGKHPAAVLAYAEQTLPTGSDWQEWWQGIAYGVVALLDRDGAQLDLVLALLDRALPANQLPGAITAVLGRLIDLDRELVLRILLTPDRSQLLGRALTPRSAAVCTATPTTNSARLAACYGRTRPTCSPACRRRGALRSSGRSPARSTCPRPTFPTHSSTYCPRTSGTTRPAGRSSFRSSPRTPVAVGKSPPTSRTTRRSRCSNRRSVAPRPTTVRRFTEPSSRRPAAAAGPLRWRRRCPGRRAFATIASRFARPSSPRRPRYRLHCWPTNTWRRCKPC